jgi:hypothetical protein
MSEWRPIETAPKDGTEIILGGMDFGPPVRTGHWGATSYDRSIKGYRRGWTAHGLPCGLDPTHWMPLPAPPKREKPNA